LRNGLGRLLCAYGFVSAVLWVGGCAARSGDAKGKISVDGRDRTYIVHVPSGYDGAAPTPLILALHGGGGAARKMDKLTGLNATSDREGFIVVYPDGVRRHWNDGRAVTEREVGGDVDDVRFLDELCRELGATYNIDPKRVYVVGISNGAMMTFRLAAERPDLYAAACGVVGGVTEDLVASHPPAGPMPIMMVVGDEDPLVPYGGGDIKVFGRKRGKILPQREAARWWAKNNGAAEEPVVTELPDRDAGDGCRVVREEYRSEKGYDVVAVTVRGGGHTWPSGWQYLNTSIIGRTTRDIDNAAIWEFFATHAKP